MARKGRLLPRDIAPFSHKTSTSSSFSGIGCLMFIIATLAVAAIAMGALG